MATTKIEEGTGNAILVCACGSETNKGCPPIEGQNDDTYRCDACHEKDNKAALEAALQPETIQGS